MPGKSKHGRGKQPHQSKKSRAMRRQEVTSPRPVAEAGAPPTVAAAAPLPPPKPAAPAKVKVIEYPYITAELRRIGILAGIIIVILVILSLVIS
ncbi:MAG TPA: hypothetical protein VJ377_07960 [Dehalococcoidales bacterium]|nr:hypothetical protein [Dehalococcoidales bacterium]